MYTNATDVVLAQHRQPPSGMPAVAFSGNGEMCSMDGVICKENDHGYKLVDESQHLELRKAYYSVVTFMDAQLGRVLDALDASGLSSNTITVLWGDHGYHLGEQGEWCKITNFEDATRVPLMISLPGQEVQHVVSQAFVELLDVYPTLVEAAGLPKRGAALEGRSLVPMLLSNAEEEEEEEEKEKEKEKVEKEEVFNVTFSQITRQHGIKMGVTMRTARYRYTEWLDVDGMNPPRMNRTAPAMNPELYAHAMDENENDFDGSENVNLASMPEYAAEVARLHAVLVERWDRGTHEIVHVQL